MRLNSDDVMNALEAAAIECEEDTASALLRCIQNRLTNLIIAEAQQLEAWAERTQTRWEKEREKMGLDT